LASHAQIIHRSAILHQILFGDRGAESIVVGNEPADEFVQSVLENLLDAGVL
jgi:hypothetical protein